MWHSCLRLLAVAVACLVLSSLEVHSHSLEKRARSRFCGNNLANVLQTVCEGVYNGAFEQQKKSEVSDDQMTLDENSEGYMGMWIGPLSEKEKEPIFPFRTRPKASSLINGAFRRFTRGVYDECCAKSCTLKELTSYCGIKGSR